MKLGGAGFWIALLSTAAVALVGVVDLRRTSPGPLTTVHGREQDLAGSSSCSECHGGWFSSMTESCNACHERIESQIELGDGLHGALGAQRASQCALCHSEHHGESYSIVNARSFALAGFADVQAFDHAILGFEMDGAHLELACAQCHEHAAAPVLPPAALRYGGLEQRCTSCHEDPHKDQFAVGCTSCHGQDDWKTLHSDDHDRNLALVGGHGDVSCRTCHEERGKHALELVGGRGTKPQARACADCHDSPHQRRFDTDAAAAMGLEREAGCVTCHAAEHVLFAEAAALTSPTQHASSGFALALPHDELACDECHSAELGDYAARFPGRDADTCSACHDDVHDGQFATGPFSSGDCIACHAREHFSPHTFDLADHARTSLPLEGAHAPLECKACHLDPEPDEPRLFRGTSDQCDQCHDDAHDAFFASRTAELAPTAHGDCARCHGTTKFAEVEPSRFDHGRWTGFAVDGAHAQEDCSTCHPISATPDDTGRTFGRVEEHFGEFGGCATCHEDPHQGHFDAASLPKRVDAREGCARCHGTSSFRALPKPFDHARWTGFALVDEHRSAACSACHEPLRVPDAHDRTWAPALGTACADCHEDPHAGQFDSRDEEPDCARCHAPDRPSFLSFDHDDSRFPLSEPHSRLECSACHHEVRARGLEFVRYRPLGTECAVCHGVQEELGLRKRTRKG